MSWFNSWFGYGLGAGTAKALFGERKPSSDAPVRWPLKQQTEQEIVADEKRYDEDEKRLDAQGATAQARVPRG